MPNQFLNTSWVSREILRLLVNKLVAAEYFNHDWQGDFNQEFAPGSNITVKFPQRFTTTDGMGYAPQAINRLSTTISLDQWIQCAFEWDDYERAVKLERSEEELRENYWDPAAAAIAQDIDSRCAKFAYQNASNVVGQLGTDPTSVQTYYQARQILMQMAVPPGKRCMLISSSMMASLGSNITNTFNPVDEITRMFKSGAIGKLADFDFFESNSLYSQTAGTFQSSVVVVGANQSGTQIIVQGTAGDVLNQGDKIAFANVNAVNPMTRRFAGPATAKRFTITQPITLTGGSDTINILPAIYGPGSQYQNVDSFPANNAALTLWPGTSSPNGKTGTVALGLTRYAFALVGSKLYVPHAVEHGGQAQDPETKIAVRKVMVWDGYRSMQINRMDSLVGMGNLYQDSGAVCVAGA
jgi:P22 coat protein - gene protein 5